MYIYIYIYTHIHNNNKHYYIHVYIYIYIYIYIHTSKGHRRAVVLLRAREVDVAADLRARERLRPISVLRFWISEGLTQA